ncbi:hypothetical protein PTE30175_02881 [Pandoraea terrae]|uniref:Uncharacterized protein n=1 Tax=Pandoraea terrae TaxID=1537710 RepID=A0A5E4VYE7_9BURK|nr:hypothetical protein PTE30175_02881 [Pandoraea terrae]
MPLDYGVPGGLPGIGRPNERAPIGSPKPPVALASQPKYLGMHDKRFRWLRRFRTPRALTFSDRPTPFPKPRANRAVHARQTHSRTNFGSRKTIRKRVCEILGTFDNGIAGDGGLTCLESPPHAFHTIKPTQGEARRAASLMGRDRYRREDPTQHLPECPSRVPKRIRRFPNGLHDESAAPTREHGNGIDIFENALTSIKAARQPRLYPGCLWRTRFIHKTPFPGVSCTNFKRLWITFWITWLS